MVPRSASSKRRPFAFAAAGALTLVALVQACVIAQPTDDVPRLPATPPTILHGSVAPSTTSVLTAWPQGDTFVVPVQVYDPTSSIVYATFIDYNPNTGAGLVAPPTTLTPPADTSNPVRTLSIAITPPAATDRCHVVEVVVALTLNGTHDNKSAHSGGDIVSWFYNPSGSIDGCPALDAGLDLDAAADQDATDGGK